MWESIWDKWRLMHRSRLWRLCILAIACYATTANNALASKTTLWPTIPFIRGQDLCEYQDAYGKSRQALMKEMTADLRSLMSAGAEGRDATEALRTIDSLIDKHRHTATSGLGMDVTLEGLIKAAVDKLYLQVRPREKHLMFYNAGSLLDLLKDVREQKRQGSLDNDKLARLSGLAWGTYAFGPGCSGEIILTLHVETRQGPTHNFSARGTPERAAEQVALQMFSQFQSTCFPSVTTVCGKPLTIVGAPGAPIGKAATPNTAEKSCQSMRARLPTQEEYEQLDILGDWNDGVTLGHNFWALKGGWIYAPDLRNPSPVRSPAEVQSREILFYCVR